MKQIKKNVLAGLLQQRPQAVSVEQLTDLSFFPGHSHYPLVISPRLEGLLLHEWIKTHQALLEEKLHQHGAVLFRNFDMAGIAGFERVVTAYGRPPMSYIDKTSPRSQLMENIYTSTDYPADQVIDMHNELSYSSNWPMRVFFYCDVPPGSGGETPIADSRQMLSLLSAGTLEKFSRLGVRYVRNLAEGIGLSWQQAYQTGNKAEVEQYCRRSGMAFEWKSDTHLRLSWQRPAIRQHPLSGENVWFNHAFFYNIHNMAESLREVFLEEELPFNTYYGDGTQIEARVIEEIREAWQKIKFAFGWKKGDILLLDNMLMAHGRNAFAGNRKIAVALCAPHQQATD